MKKLLIALAVLTAISASLASVTVFDEDIFNIKLGGYFQFRWDYDMPADDNADAEGELKVKRAKLDVKGDIGDYFSFKIVDQIHKSGHNLEELKLSFKPVDMLHIHFGLIKPAGSWSHMLSSSKQPFINRPLHDDWSPDYSEGLIAQLKFENWINLQLGVFENDKEAWGYEGGNGATDIAITAYLDSNPIEGMHIGGFLFSGSDYTYAWDDDGDDTTDPIDVYFPLIGYGGHVNFDHDYFFVGAELAMGNWNLADAVDADGDSVANFNIDSTSGMSYAVDLYGRLPIGEELLHSVELGGRYESFDANTDVDNDAMNQFTIGLNLNFLPKHYAKLQLNYVMEMPEDDNTDGDSKIIAQLQLKF